MIWWGYWYRTGACTLGQDEYRYHAAIGQRATIDARRRTAVATHALYDRTVGCAFAPQGWFVAEIGEHPLGGQYLATDQSH